MTLHQFHNLMIDKFIHFVFIRMLDNENDKNPQLHLAIKAYL